ncbi:hypothetical protein BJ944DRAFT_240459 [Cunninghamella echinulata]|nr:hypothetical protein BJ944DRAFT_240459 [Cunninghamella echinulata]
MGENKIDNYNPKAILIPCAIKEFSEIINNLVLDDYTVVPLLVSGLGGPVYGDKGLNNNDIKLNNDINLQQL